ncbi:MAG: cation-transporting P-type ATPase [Smithella sp.]
MQSIQNPWVLTPDEALTATGGSPDGLATESVRQRLMDFGQNVLITKDVEPWYMLFLQQFANPLVYMLIGAAGIKAYFKGATDAAVIGAVLLFMAIIGFAQEMKSRE